MRLLDEISGVPKTAALEARNELIGLISPSGLANEFIEIIVLFPAALALIWILQALVHVGRREWRLPTDEAFQPSVAVVIAPPTEGDGRNTGAHPPGDSDGHLDRGPVVLDPGESPSATPMATASCSQISTNGPPSAGPCLGRSE